MLATLVLCAYTDHIAVDAFSMSRATTRGATLSRQGFFATNVPPSSCATYRQTPVAASSSDFDSGEDAEHGVDSSTKDVASTTEAKADAVIEDTEMKRKGAGSDGVGGYDPGESLRQEETLNVGDPQIKVIEKERSVTSILKELAAIQQQGPQKYCILGTRHCSYLHQQIIELL